MDVWQRCLRFKKGTTINSLPDECLQDIFSRVVDSSTSLTLRLPHIRDSLDNHLIISHPLHCAVVSKRWQAAVDPAIKSLHFDVTAPAAETLIQRARRFVNLTRITIAFDSHLGPSTFVDLLVALATNTPQLEELMIENSYHSLPEHSYQTGLALALTNSLPAWTSLRKLTLGSLPGESEGESLALLDFLGQITSLRELDINLAASEVPLDNVCECLARLTGVPVIKMRIWEPPPPSMAALTALKHLSLDLVGFEGVHLPDTLGVLSSLTSLKVEAALEPRGLPNSIGSLTALRRLVLDTCHGFHTLPGSLGNLQALNHLEIYNCESLVSLPNSVGNLHALRYLSIRCCSSLSELPASMGELRQLTHLEVFCETFEKLPDSICQLSELTHLALGCSSKLKLLPYNIGALGNLRVLDICSCPLQELPASVCQLTRLSQLTASQCSGLKRLPRHIGRLQSLMELYLHDNSELEVLPEGIADLRSLTTLMISECPKLCRLPKGVTRLICLEKLWINQSAPEISKYFLADGAVANFQGLRELTVDAGPVQGPWVPQGLTRLAGLERLEIWGTVTEQQPQGAQGGGGGILGVLSGLFKSVGGSRYSSLCALRQLQHLTLKNSSCEHLPRELLKMPALTRLTWHPTPVENGLSSNREVVKALRGKGCAVDIKVDKHLFTARVT